MHKMLVWLGLIVLILGLVGTVVAYNADSIIDTGNEEIGDTQMMYVNGGVGILVVGVVILLLGMMIGVPAPAAMAEEIERGCPECGATIADPMATECPECGAPLAPSEEVRTCPECSATIADPYTTECPECGAPLSFEEEAVRSCPECGATVADPAATECPECGAALPEPQPEEEELGEEVECPSCGALIAADATECPECGVEFEEEGLDEGAEGGVEGKAGSEEEEY